MANKTDERLLDSFREASGRQTSSQDDFRSVAEELAKAVGEPAVAEAAREIAEGTAAGAQERAKAAWDAVSTGMTPETEQARADARPDVLSTEMTPEAAGAAAAAQGQADSNLYGESGTPAGSNVRSSSGSTTGSGSSTGSSVASTVAEYLGGGGVVSLIPKLINLFSGGPSAPPVLEKYAMPSPISFESADTGGGLSASDFDQMGAPRMYSNTAESPEASNGGPAANAGVGGQDGGTSGGGGTAAAPHISVTVQTMDAQSFLDNSDQIAKAVRGAMLNLSSINDVVSEI